MTGRESRPQSTSPAQPYRDQPPTDAQAAQSLNDTSYLETANGLAIVTLCWGSSSGIRCFSVGCDPIMNSPAGTTTISGQSLAHSLKACPGFSARSASGLSTYGRSCTTM